MANPVHADTRPDDTVGFQNYWLAETVRLRESQWGPLQDSNETRRARTLGGDFTQRLLLRAIYLGQREEIDTSIRQWAGGAKLAFFLLLVLAILTGAATALGALGDGTRQVNLILALTAMLGLHALTFLFWCLSSIVPSGNTYTGLGEIWLWLTGKLARGPLAALIPRALVGMLARQGALRPLLGAVSHALWACALTAMLITLVALLSARRYTFSWETTLLSPDTFVWLTNSLGWLPSKLGFSMPPDALIRASDGLQALPATAHALWSGWLIGCLVCYGLLPRLIALTVSAISAQQRIKKLTLDTELPGYIELRDRLEPHSVSGGIDAPAAAEPGVQTSVQHLVDTSNRQAIVGVELAREEHWPPATLASHIADLGVIDDRPQRQYLLDAMQTRPPHKLLIVCDGRQTPDRGVIAFILELTALTKQTHIVILAETSPAHTTSVSRPDAVAVSPERLSTWSKQLQRAGLPVENIHFDVAVGLTWLGNPVSDTSCDRLSSGTMPSAPTPSPDGTS